MWTLRGFFAFCLCLFAVLAFPQSSGAIPLKDGSYRIGGRYYDVYVRGERICYVKATATSAFISSVKKSPSVEDYYYLEAVEGEPVYLHQQDDTTLLLGSLDNMVPMTIEEPFNEMTSDVEDCLSSQGRYALSDSSEPSD